MCSLTIARLVLEQLEPRRLLASWQNDRLRADVNDDRLVSPSDALAVINYLNSDLPRSLPIRPQGETQPYIDVNGDDRVSPVDALIVINAMNLRAESPIVVAGLAPASDPNGNGVVLLGDIVVQGQSRAGDVVELRSSSNDGTVIERRMTDELGKFAFSLQLASGVHQLTVTTIDELGRQAQSTIEVKVGDVVQDWNAAVLNAVRIWSTTSNDPYQGRIVKSQPPRVARNLAMIHGAMFDVLNSFDPQYDPYLIQLTPGAGANPVVAAAAAADRIARKLYLDTDELAIWDASLQEAIASVTSNFDLESSLLMGRTVADRMLSERQNDGANIAGSYVPGSEPGDWNRTYPDFLPPLLPNWPNVKPFALDSGNQFRPPAPPALDSSEYASDVDEVMRLGGYGSSERTSEQQKIALFWADGGGTFTPPGHWNQIASDVAFSKQSSLLSNARMFALLNIALADAGIASWDAKYAYGVWRPIDAIRKADADGSPDTIQDVTWLPLLATPPFPSYTSGHSTFSGAAAIVLTSIFGDNVTFVSRADAHDASNQKPLPVEQRSVRSFSSFWQAAEEAGASRIYGGIHFSFDNTAGLETGKSVAEYVIANQLLERSSV